MMHVTILVKLIPPLYLGIFHVKSADPRTTTITPPTFCWRKLFKARFLLTFHTVGGWAGRARPRSWVLQLHGENTASEIAAGTTVIRRCTAISLSLCRDSDGERCINISFRSNLTLFSRKVPRDMDDFKEATELFKYKACCYKIMSTEYVLLSTYSIVIHYLHSWNLSSKQWGEQIAWDIFIFVHQPGIIWRHYDCGSFVSQLHHLVQVQIRQRKFNGDEAKNFPGSRERKYADRWELQFI